MVHLSTCGQCASSRKLPNFKNIAHALAVRHQYLEMYLAIEVTSEHIVTTGCRSILFEHLPEMLKLHIVEHGLARDNAVALNSVTIDGFAYSCPNCHRG